MIQYTFDHEYAGDLASLGIEYQSGDNDYEIVVTEPDDHRLTPAFEALSCYYHTV
jgi:hypothetical protein